jgi:mono/diheme cytochrome c family protein
MRIIVRVVSALVLLCFAVSAQEESKPAATAEARTAAAEFKIPPDAAKAPNPVKPTPTSLAQGKKMYGFDCALCHGKDGDGKGDLAADMNLKLADYRDSAALKDMTDGEMFYIIKN